MSIKVICIDASNKRTPPFCKPSFKERDELYVVNEDNEHYKVLGHEVCACGCNSAWFKSRFIPVSDIDEVELSENRQIIELAEKLGI